MSEKRSFLAAFLPVMLIVLTSCSWVQATPVVAPSATAQASATKSSIAAAIALTNTTTPAVTSAPGSVPIPAAAATPSAVTLPPSDVTLKQANSCNLINSNDLAHLFPPHNEIVRDPPKTAPVSHPPFSTSAASGMETTCVFYDFHQPGTLAGWMLQVTYRLDTPDPSAVQAWSQAWDAARAQSGQPVSNLGDDAFTSGTNLFIKKGNTYLAFESTDTHVDEKTAAGVQQLLADEKQLAEAALEHLK